jgi:hypothetical protein
LVVHLPIISSLNFFAMFIACYIQSESVCRSVYNVFKRKKFKVTFGKKVKFLYGLTEGFMDRIISCDYTMQTNDKRNFYILKSQFYESNKVNDLGWRCMD